MQCLVLEPPLFAAVGRLRQCLPGFLPPGGTAEATLTATDSGIDLLLEVKEPPSVRALEACAERAAKSDLARLVWRTPNDEILVVERRPARVLLSGVAVAFPPGAFLQASRAAERILVAEVLAGVGMRQPVLDLFAGSAPSLSPWRETAAFTPQRARRARQLRWPKPPQAGVGSAWSAETSRATRCVQRISRAMPPRYSIRRAPEPHYKRRRWRPRHSIQLSPCNPGTFGRDAAALLAGRFHLEQLTPVDQFVWTPHLDKVAGFRR